MSIRCRKLKFQVGDQVSTPEGRGRVDISSVGVMEIIDESGKRETLAPIFWVNGKYWFEWQLRRQR